MRNYELVVVLKPDAPDALKEVEDIIKRYVDSIEIQEWGMKNFAYKVKRYDAGYYYIIKFSYSGKKNRDITKMLLANSNILRFLIRKVEKEEKKEEKIEGNKRKGKEEKKIGSKLKNDKKIEK